MFLVLCVTNGKDKTVSIEIPSLLTSNLRRATSFARSSDVTRKNYLGKVIVFQMDTDKEYTLEDVVPDEQERFSSNSPIILIGLRDPDGRWKYQQGDGKWKYQSP